MPSKKKVNKKTQSAVSVKNANNSLMMLALACAVLIASYVLFTNLSSNRAMMQTPTYPAGQTQPNMMESQMTLQLNEQNNSGEYGNAILTDMNGKTMVHVEIKNAPKGVSQPAHIHVGSCIDLGAIKYPLTNLVNGKSDTVINVSLKDLVTQGSLALNVHKSVSLVNQYVSCGNVQ